jgi:hypothetical protein
MVRRELDDAVLRQDRIEPAAVVLRSTVVLQSGRGGLMAEQNYYPLFKLLIERTRTLATVCDNAAEILSEDFKDMVTGPLEQVNIVLAQCPDVTAWDGSFSEDDIVIEGFRHDSQPPGPDVGVRVRHIPTGLSIESYSKRTRVDNELVARRALADRVQRRWEAQQEAQQRALARSGRRDTLGNV